MADLRGRPTELRPLIRVALAAAVLVTLAHARPVAAQSDPLAVAAAEIGVTRLAGQWVPAAGGALSVRLAPWIDVGGAARVALADPSVTRDGSRVRIHFGYAGLRVSTRPAPERARGVRLDLLVAAGNVDLEDAGAGTAIDSDNGALLEPSLSVTRAVAGPLSMSAAAAWRFVAGFDLLGDVDTRDLRGPTFSVGLAIGPL